MLALQPSRATLSLAKHSVLAVVINTANFDPCSKPSARMSLNLVNSRPDSGLLAHEHAIANPVIHVAPTNAPAPKSQQPDDKRSGIPNKEEGHFFPESGFLQAPATHKPGDCHTKHDIRSKVRQSNAIPGMSEKHCQTPRQALCEHEADVAPRAHVAHHRQPAEALDEKAFQGIVVRNGLDGIRQQLDLVTLLRDVPADQQIVRRAVLD